MPKISIIIGTYNHCEDLLKPCCEALIKYTNLEDKEIIIVSNGSKDNTREYVESLGSPFKLLWFDDPLGYSKANNEGIKASTGDYIVLLNNDAFLLPQEKDSWINMLLSPFNDEKTGITGPMKNTFSINEYSSFEYISFFCAMIKREVIEKVGLLDEIYEIGGCEDIEFCVNSQHIGYCNVEVFSDINRIKNKDNSLPGLTMGYFPIFHGGFSTRREIDFTKSNEKNYQTLTERLLQLKT